MTFSYSTWKEYMPFKGAIQLTILAAIVILAASGHSSAVERLEIESNPNTDYLPYSLDSIEARVDDIFSRPIDQPLQVVGPLKDLRSAEVQGFACNYPPPDEKEHRFTLRAYPERTVLWEIGVGFTITDWRMTWDSAVGAPVVISVGFAEDTVYLLKANCQPDGSVQRHYLALRCISPLSKSRATVNAWITALEDLGADGQLEMFVTIEGTSSFRRLYCIEVNSMEVKWERSVASPISNQPVFVSHSHNRSFVVFATGNPSNNVCDSEFDDQYRYFAVLDDEGELVYKAILACNWEQISCICPAEISGQFYVVHALDFLDSVDSSAMEVRSHYITKINLDGIRMSSAEVPCAPSWVRVIPWGEDESPHVCVRFRDGSFSIYDTSLALVSRCERTSISLYEGRLKIAGEPDSVYVFRDGLYNSRLSKILAFPFAASSLETVSYDSKGNTVELVINKRNQYYIGRLRKKTYLDLASVFYHRNQSTVVNSLFALLAGLSLMTYFRFRAKQKLEVLRLKQDAIIAEEKYRQAKEIAGGFAHEIRNALFPADGLLTKLRRINDLGNADVDTIKKYHGDTHTAVSRAIGITRLISTYTKLDSEYNPETTDLASAIDTVMEANELRIEKQEVVVTRPDHTRIPIIANRQQLEIVLNNLLLNSLDALEEVGVGKIDIGIELRAKTVDLRFADNGAGIAPDKIAKIFDAFYSTKPSTGVGLGLSMVKKIVEMYGGTITVSSEIGKGTQFDITWRRAE